MVGLGLMLMLLKSFQLFAQSDRVVPPYLDPSQPVEVRVEDLLRRMTLKEKVGQLNLPYPDQIAKKDLAAELEAIKEFVAGTHTQEIGPGSGLFDLSNPIRHLGAQQQAQYFNELQKIARTQTRLKIPLLEDEEGIHGVILPGATIFPEGLAIGSTFDVDLVKSIYAAAAEEARAVGVNMLSTLVLELDRDPRMGRNEEAYTEDPYLYSRIAENIVWGAQGGKLDAPDKVITVLTDFPTQSEPVSGLERGAVQLSERALRENVLLPWTAAITKAGGLGVMAAYSEIDDVPAHSSAKWLTKVLRQELGFKGLVLSEGTGFDTLIYEGIVPTQKEAGALALWAGVDLNITYEPAYLGPLVENVEEGRIPIMLVDRAVRRVLEQKFRLGLFEHPYVDVERAARIAHSKEHQEVALQAAREGIVLLKNDNNLLPLKKNLKSIAVIGPNADNSPNQLGDYSAEVTSQHVVTVLEGIKAKVPPDTKVVYAPGCEIMGTDKSGFAVATRAARNADVAIVVVGEKQSGHGWQQTDGEGHDVASLDLTGVQEDLVKAVVGSGTPTVVVLINGRPLSIRWLAEHVPSIAEAWEPGEKGGDAVADILFGDYNPSGRLAITIPRHVGQLPDYYNYQPSKGYWISHGWNAAHSYVDMPATPLYPFGYGLSYTRFNYSSLHLDPGGIRPAGNACVSVDVKNAGSRAGEETVQMYLHERFGPVSTPVKRLRGFKRVFLKPGETKTLSFTVTPDDLQLLNRDMHWVVVPGTFDIMVGKSSADIQLHGTLEVKGPSGFAAYQ